jgi:hypothetical protein
LEVVRIVYVDEAGTLFYFLKKRGETNPNNMCMAALELATCGAIEGWYVRVAAWALFNRRKLQVGWFCFQKSMEYETSLWKYRINLIDSVFSDEPAQ